MKAASPALIAHLNANRAFECADLYEITLIGGAVLRYTSFGSMLLFENNSYMSLNIKRGALRWTATLETDRLDVTIFPLDSDLVGTMSMVAAARLGIFDGAELVLKRLYMTYPGDVSLGAIHQFSGRIGSIGLSRSDGIRLEVVSPLELLDTQLPGGLFQAGCLNTVYDAACGVNRAAFAIASHVIDASSTTWIWVDFYEPDLTGGTIRFDSGDSVGYTATISGHVKHPNTTHATVYFASPLINRPHPGDSFTAWRGCNRQLSTCESVFNNKLNYRGFPYIPAPEVGL